MKKETTVKAHKRTRKGKAANVRQHTMKYDSAEEKAKKKSRKIKGAGCELASKKECGSDND